MKHTILISGYEPIGNDSSNPSSLIANALNNYNNNNDYEFKGVVVPVSRSRCLPAMYAAIEKYHPDLIICTGLAYGRCGISIERIAINCIDFPWKDNDGVLALNESIDVEGPSAYFSTLPIRNIMEALHKKSIPAYISNSAGTFCCNMLMYGTLNYIAKNHPNIKSGMIHVPYTPDMAVNDAAFTPSMSVDIMIEAIKTAAITSIEDPIDRPIICGAAQ